MLTKRKIMVALGIVLAVFIGLSTGIFGPVRILKGPVQYSKTP